MEWIRRWIESCLGGSAVDRRRYPRYTVREADQARAFFSIDGIGAYMHDNPKALERSHPIVNLSADGIALFLSEEENPDLFQPRQRVTLHLVIEGRMLTVPCEVVYVFRGLKCMGLRFLELTREQHEAIARFLDVRFLASALQEIPISSGVSMGKGCRWFHGKNNTDLFVWQAPDGSHISRCQFVFVDQIVEWSEAEGLRTATVKRADFALSQTSLFPQAPPPVEYDAARDEGAVAAAREILSLAKIDPAVKEELLRHLAPPNAP